MHRCTGCISRIFNASTLHNAENQHLCLHLAAASYQRAFFAFTLRISIIFQLVSNYSRSSELAPWDIQVLSLQSIRTLFNFSEGVPSVPAVTSPPDRSSFAVSQAVTIHHRVLLGLPWSRWWQDFCNYNHQANDEFGWSRKMWIPEVYYFQFG